MSNDTLPLEAPYRAAIYYAPAANSSGWQLGSEWLGRCALTGRSMPQPRIDGMAPERFADLTKPPRHYGWHATLKAPFRLAPGQTLQTLRTAVQDLCSRHQAFDLPPLQVSRLGNFLALRPAYPQAELARLAEECVRQLHGLAMPLTDSELARRRNASLSPQQDALLQAWGYPYVMDEYRFHLSLTGPLHGLPENVLAALHNAATRHFRELPPCRVDQLSLFVEPTPGAPFRLVEQLGLLP